jgi:hypothetical protein
MKMHGHLLLPEGKTIDIIIIDHTEGTIHSVVRMKDPGTGPPRLVSETPWTRRSAARLQPAAQDVRIGCWNQQRNWRAL